MKKRTLHELQQEAGLIANFVRTKRKKLGHTQLELAKKMGVGLRFLKELEQGKKSVRLDKVTQVLNYFGYEIAPVLKKKESPLCAETDQSLL